MRELYTFPNLLSLTRVGLGATAALWIVNGSRAYLIGAAVLIALGELTDFLDGHLARRLDGETDLGKSLDASCDAIFHLSVFLALMIVGWMPLWAAVAIYAAEVAFPYLRSFAKQIKAEASPPVLDAIHAGMHGLTLLAVVLIVYFAGSLAGIAGVAVIPLVFAANVLVTYTVLAVSIWPLVKALRAQHRSE